MKAYLAETRSFEICLEMIPFGTVVRISPFQDRHDATSFPYAIIVSDGVKVAGSDNEMRYRGLFIDNLLLPTEMKVFNLYSSEIESIHDLDPRAEKLYNAWYEKHGG